LDVTLHTPGRITMYEDGKCIIEKCFNTKSGAPLKVEEVDNDKPISKGIALYTILQKFPDIGYEGAEKIYKRLLQ